MPTGVFISFAARELPRLAPALRFPVPPGGPSERYRVLRQVQIQGTENISMNSSKSLATTKGSSLGAFKIGIQDLLGNFLGRRFVGSCGSVGRVAIPPIIGGVFLFAWCALVGSTALLFFFMGFFGTLVQLGTCSVPTRALGGRAIRIVCSWLRCVSCTPPDCTRRRLGTLWSWTLTEYRAHQHFPGFVIFPDYGRVYETESGRR